MAINNKTKKRQHSLCHTVNRITVKATDRFGAKFILFAFWVIMIAVSRATLWFCEALASFGAKVSDVLPGSGKFLALVGGAVGVLTYLLLLLAFCSGVLASIAAVLECRKVARGWRGFLQFVCFTTLFGIAAGLPIFLGMMYGEHPIALRTITNFGQFLIDKSLVLLIIVIVAVCAVMVHKIVVWRRSQ